jgi:signal transduction histidine kinase
VFAAVADEVGALFDADATAVLRFEPDGRAVVMAAKGWTTPAVGTPFVPAPDLALAAVRSTARAVRSDADDPRWARVPESTRIQGIRSVVDTPIVVDGDLWGVVTVASRRGRLPLDLEQRMADFTELVATAIANAEAHTALTESRARIVATADETRRRIERDLHDGAQQRLVSLALRLRAAQAELPAGLDEIAAEVDGVAAGLTGALDELRELARGIHPAMLAEGGLKPALKTLARRSAVPVELDVRTEGRLTERLEIGAYYVVSEALANVAKHARASMAVVDVDAGDDALRISVRDNGVGGAGLGRGSGLVGLKDRVEALGGRIVLQSEPGAGTSLTVELPLAESRSPGT